MFEHLEKKSIGMTPVSWMKQSPFFPTKTLFPKGKSFLINLIELIKDWEGEAKEGKAIEEFARYKDSSLQL